MLGSLSVRTTRWLLLAVTLLGGGLRFWAIGAKTIWLDEAFSIWIARHPPGELIDWLVRIDQHPPLYYLSLAGWLRLWGDLQGAVRSLSALCSTATIPLLYLIGRAFGCDRFTALLAALLLALSPFHVRYAQEARMYAMLTLLAAGAIYGAARFLQGSDNRSIAPRDWITPRQWRAHPAMGPALTLALCQAGVMWTHNTATVFFPLALNLPVAGAWLYRQRSGQAVSMPAVNAVGFAGAWLQTQCVALLLWVPWLIPFVRQARGVAREFWIPPPDADRIVTTLQAFAFAHLPTFALGGLLLIGYLAIACAGLVSLRTRAAWGGLLLSLWLTPFVGELLVSLRRPIFTDRTLIWSTLALYLLMALGIRRDGRAHVQTISAPSPLTPLRTGVIQTALALLIVAISGVALTNYFRTFEKEEWAAAAEYVAARARPDDLILFNATWVQLPFEYYFRHYEVPADLRGIPSDLFDSGELEPKMRAADLPYLGELTDGRERVWLVYSHDWYTDPEQLIPHALEDWSQRNHVTHFSGLRVFRYAGPDGN